MNVKYALELSQYKIKLLIYIIDKELKKSENQNRTLELIQLKDYLIGIIKNN